MKVFLVTVIVATDAGGGRYFDSIWVRKENADERQKQLTDELRRSGFKVWSSGGLLSWEWKVSVVEAQANDARVADQGAKEE